MTGPFFLVHDVARRKAIEAVKAAPMGWVVELREGGRNLDQNAAAHACLTDIARQVTWHGHRFDVDTWKRLTLAAFYREKGDAPKMVPALDGKGFDIVYHRSSKMGKREFSEWLDWLYAFGAENGVMFREKRHAA